MGGTTIVEIARRSGVSQPTVSDVLNNRWRERRIAAPTAKRIQITAKQLNYRPNRLVRSLQSGRTHSVALVMPAITHAFFPHIAAGVEQEAKRHGYHVLLSYEPTGELVAAELESLLERRVDGLILAPHFQPQVRAKCRELLQQGIPLVFVNDYFEDVPCSAVVGDDWNGMYRATEHLIQLGHQRIAHLAGNRGPTVTQMRVDGYHAALRQHGLATPDAYVQWFRVPGGDPADGMQRLLALPEPPTAVAAHNDLTALGGIRATLAAGRRVPQDVAFVGYGDDLEEVWFQKIPLTTVRVDAEEMGRRAMALLIAEMHTPGTKRIVEKIPAELVVRESCGAASAAGGARGNDGEPRTQEQPTKKGRTA